MTKLSSKGDSPKTEVAQHSVHPTLRQAQGPLVGVCAIYKHFSGLELIPAKWRCLVRLVVQPVETHQPLTQAIGWLRQVWNLVYFYLDEIEYVFYNALKENTHEKSYCA